MKELLDYFDRRLTEDRHSNAKEIAVDKEKLINLLSEVETMRTVQSAQNCPPR